MGFAAVSSGRSSIACLELAHVAPAVVPRCRGKPNPPVGAASLWVDLARDLSECDLRARPADLELISKIIMAALRTQSPVARRVAKGIAGSISEPRNTATGLSARNPPGWVQFRALNCTKLDPSATMIIFEMSSKHPFGGGPLGIPPTAHSRYAHGTQSWISAMPELTEHQQMITDTARRFVREQIIAPRLDQALDRAAEFPHTIMRALWELGLMNLEFPEDLGGAGLSCHDHVLVLEEINYGCLGIGTSVAANSLAALPLLLADNVGARKEYLGRLTAAHGYAAFACSEPDAGSDVANLSTKFTKHGDKFVLNGRKRWITNADVADFYVVFAREQGSKGHGGIATFVVEAGWPGVRWESLIHKLGQRCSHTGDVVFEDVEVPMANLVAGPEHGFKLAMATFDRSRPWIAGGAAGVIRRARDESVRYAMQRRTFGEPIINHQMVSSMLADMEIAYLASRLLCLHAADAVDTGNLRGSHGACAKAFGGDAAMRVTTDAVQIFGGYGYTQDFVVEKLMRDAKLLQIYEGTSQIQRLVIARNLMRQAVE